MKLPVLDIPYGCMLVLPTISLPVGAFLIERDGYGEDATFSNTNKSMEIRFVEFDENGPVNRTSAPAPAEQVVAAAVPASVPAFSPSVITDDDFPF